MATPTPGHDTVYTSLFCCVAPTGAPGAPVTLARTHQPVTAFTTVVAQSYGISQNTEPTPSSPNTTSIGTTVVSSTTSVDHAAPSQYSQSTVILSETVPMSNIRLLNVLESDTPPVWTPK